MCTSRVWTPPHASAHTLNPQTGSNHARARPTRIRRGGGGGGRAGGRAGGRPFPIHPKRSQNQDQDPPGRAHTCHLKRSSPTGPAVMLPWLCLMSCSSRVSRFVAFVVAMTATLHRTAHAENWICPLPSRGTRACPPRNPPRREQKKRPAYIHRYHYCKLPMGLIRGVGRGHAP